MALTRDAFDVSGEKTLLEERELLEGDISLIMGFLDTMYFRGGRRPAGGKGNEEETRETAASEAASAGSDTAGLSLPGRLSRIGIGLQKPMRLLCRLVFWLPAVLWGISVAVAFLRLPDGIGISFSITGGSRILRLFSSLIPALFAGITLWLHLFIISINLNAL